MDELSLTLAMGPLACSTHISGKGHLSPLPVQGCPQRRGLMEKLKWDYIGGYYELNSNLINKLLLGIPVTLNLKKKEKKKSIM